MINPKNSFFTIMVFILAFYISSSGQPGNGIDDFVFRPRPSTLFSIPPYRGNYIDQSGKVVIKTNPELGISDSREFSEGLAPVKQGNLWGYIDTKGRLVIKPQFVRAEYFFDGLARVRKPDAKSVTGSLWGYIDKTGKLVHETKFEEAFDFSDGMALVFYENKYAYLTPIGKIAFEVSKRPYLRLDSYSEGLAQFCAEQGCGFMDKTQKVIIKPRQGIVGNFHDGRAMFRLLGGDDNLRYKYGFIDKTGKVVIELVWDGAMKFSDGVAIVESRTNGKAVIDTSGKVIIDFKKANIAEFLDIGSFHEGLGRIKVLAALKDSLPKPIYGFIDKTGKVVIKPRFQIVSQFNSGLAFVQCENGDGYIDKTGNIIWRDNF
jgi:WG containing repeat